MIILTVACGLAVIVLLVTYHKEHDRRVQLEDEYRIACDLGDAIEKGASEHIDQWCAEHKAIREMDRTKYNKLFDEHMLLKSDLSAFKSTARSEEVRLEGELRNSQTKISSLVSLAESDTKRWDGLEKENDQLKTKNNDLLSMGRTMLSKRLDLDKENGKLKTEIDELSERLRCAGNPYSIESFDPDAPRRFGEPYVNPDNADDHRYIGQFGDFDCWLGEIKSTYKQGRQFVIGTVNERGIRVLTYIDGIKCYSGDKSYSQFAKEAAYQYVKDNNLLPRNALPKGRNDLIFLGRSGNLLDCWFSKSLPEDCFNVGKPGVCLVDDAGDICGWSCGGLLTTTVHYKQALTFAIERGLLPKEEGKIFDPDAAQLYEQPQGSYVFDHPKFVGRYTDSKQIKEYDCWLSCRDDNNDDWKLTLAITDGDKDAKYAFVSNIQTGRNSDKFIEVRDSLAELRMLPRTEPPKDENKPIFLGQEGDYDAWFVKAYNGDTGFELHYPAIYLTIAVGRDCDKRLILKNIDEKYRKVTRPAAVAICKGYDLAVEQGLVAAKQELGTEDAVDPVTVPTGVDYPGNRDKPRYSPPGDTVKPEFLGCVGDYDAWIVKSGDGSHCDYPAIICDSPDSKVTQVIGAIGNAYRSWAADNDHPQITSICKGLDLAIEQGHVEGKFTFPKHGKPTGHENLTFLCRHDKFDVWLSQPKGHPSYINVFGQYYDLSVTFHDINNESYHIKNKSYRADKTPSRIAACKGYDIAAQRGLLKKEEPTGDFNPNADQHWDQPNKLLFGEHSQFVGQYKNYDCWLSYSKKPWRLFLTIFDGDESGLYRSNVVDEIKPSVNSEQMVKVWESLKQLGMIPRFNLPSDQIDPVFLGQNGDYDVWFVESMQINDSGNPNYGRQSICVVHRANKDKENNRDFMPCNELLPGAYYRTSKDGASKVICAGYDMAIERNLIS